MSTLREMAQEVSKRLDGEVDFFLVVRQRTADPKTGKTPTIVAANVTRDAAVEMASVGTTRLILKRLADATRRKKHGSA